MENNTMVSSPNTPSGQGGAAPGRPAVNRATAATPPAKKPATPIRTADSQGARGRSATAAVPRMVTGATSGATRTLASSEYVENCGWSITMTGPHSTWADRGTATAAAAQRGTLAGNQPMTQRPSTMMPRVASTESRNPKLTPSSGSTSSRAITARQRKLSPRPARPPAREANAMAPISDALSTLASGPTMRTNRPRPVSATAAAGTLAMRNE